MSTELTNLRVTEDELHALSKAAEERFGTSSRVSYGAMARLLSEEYIEDSRA